MGIGYLIINIYITSLKIIRYSSADSKRSVLYKDQSMGMVMLSKSLYYLLTIIINTMRSEFHIKRTDLIQCFGEITVNAIRQLVLVNSSILEQK
jgi:hypothetical protein